MDEICIDQIKSEASRLGWHGIRADFFIKEVRYRATKDLISIDKTLSERINGMIANLNSSEDRKADIKTALKKNRSKWNLFARIAHIYRMVAFKLINIKIRKLTVRVIVCETEKLGLLREIEETGSFYEDLINHEIAVSKAARQLSAVRLIEKKEEVYVKEGYQDKV